MMNALDSQTICKPPTGRPLIPSTSTLKKSFKKDMATLKFMDGVQEPRFPTVRRTMRFHIPHEVEPLIVSDVCELIIGRKTKQTRHNNMLDLSLQYGHMLGVSREHARITYEGGCYYISDLNSCNGTFLNNVELTAHRKYAIASGDEVRIGHLIMVVSYS
ncbi:MAG: FHA domain-containing protein [Chloroflexota bacterium]